MECKYARPEQKIEVIAGTNLPMIVTAVTMLDMEDDPRSLADEPVSYTHLDVYKRQVV